MAAAAPAEDTLVAAGTQEEGEERVAVEGIAAVEVVLAPVPAEPVVDITEQTHWRASRWSRDVHGV